MLKFKINILQNSFLLLHATFVNGGASWCNEAFYEALCFADLKKRFHLNEVPCCMTDEAASLVSG